MLCWKPIGSIFNTIVVTRIPAHHYFDRNRESMTWFWFHLRPTYQRLGKFILSWCVKLIKERMCKAWWRYILSLLAMWRKVEGAVSLTPPRTTTTITTTTIWARVKLRSAIFSLAYHTFGENFFEYQTFHSHWLMHGSKRFLLLNSNPCKTSVAYLYCDLLRLYHRFTSDSILFITTPKKR